MKDATRDAIIALVAVDDTMTPDQREWVAMATRTEPAVLSTQRVQQILGCSRVYVKQLADRGLITPVKGIGAAGRNRGYTSESVRRYAQGTTTISQPHREARQAGNPEGKSGGGVRTLGSREPMAV